MLTVNSNHVADFLEVRDLLNQIIHLPEQHVILNYFCGPLNSFNIKESPYPNFTFRFQLEFVFRDQANENDLKLEVKPFSDNRIPSLSAETTLNAINLVSVTREISGNEQPSLIYISSETSLLNISKDGRNQYIVSLLVECIPADSYDNISRLPINSDTLQGIVNIKGN